MTDFLDQHIVQDLALSDQTRSILLEIFKNPYFLPTSRVQFEFKESLDKMWDKGCDLPVRIHVYSHHQQNQYQKLVSGIEKVQDESWDYLLLQTME